jgi:hypothetical protein
MNTTVVSGQDNMLANYLKAEKTRTFKALMQGHGKEDYYLGKIIDQPSKWRGRGLSMQSLRHMQSRGLLMVLFDNSAYMTARLGSRVSDKITGWMAESAASGSARRRFVVATGVALCAVLAVSIVLLNLSMQNEPGRQLAISGSSIHGGTESAGDLGSNRI